MENEYHSQRVSLNINPTTLLPGKAIVDGETVVGKQIGIQVTNSDGSSVFQTGCENLLLSNNLGVWGLNKIVYVSSSSIKLYAYYPYSATAGDFTGTGATSSRLLNVPAAQAMINQTDYLWAAQDKTTPAGSTNINNINPSVTLKLNHSLAQIAFVVWKESYTGAGVISQIEIKDNSTTLNLKINKAVTNDLKMKLADGTITGGQTSPTIAISGVGSTISLTSDPGADTETLKNSVNAYLLLVPTTIADKTKVQFTFTIDGNTFPATLEGTGSVSWQQGNQYIYKIKVYRNTLSIASVSVTPWSTNSSVTIPVEGGI